MGIVLDVMVVPLELIGKGSWDTKLCSAVLFLVIVLPLCLLRDISKLRFSASMGCLFSFYVTVCIIVECLMHDATNPMAEPAGATLAQFDIRVGSVLAIFTFAFVMHVNIGAMYHQLKDPTRERMRKVIRYTTFTC